MSELLGRPLIFLSYANMHRCVGRPLSPEEENKNIAEILHPLEEKGACEIIREDPDANVYFYDLASHPDYQHRISVLHIAGGKFDRRYIYLDSASGEVEMNADTFADFLAAFPNLQVVFISGSATPRIVRKILIQTQAVVVRISNDERNTDIHREFYSHVARGTVIKRAFGKTMVKSGDHLMYEILTLEELTAPPFQKRDILEGMYVRLDEKGALDWKLSPAFYLNIGNSQPGIEAKTRIEEPDRQPSHWLKPVMAGFTSLLGVALLLFGLFSPVPDQFMGQMGTNTICPFPDDGETYHVLVMPFFEEPNCRGEDKRYKTAIREQLETFRSRTNLKLNIQYHDARCPSDDLFARSIGGACNAQLMIWGSYSPSPEVGETMVEIHYSSTNQYNEYQIIGDTEDVRNVPTESFELIKPELTGRVEDIIYWGLANKQFKQRNYQQAVEYLEQINYLEDTGPVDQMIATCFLRMGDFDAAIAHYNRLIESKEDDPLVYIARGKAYAEMQNFERALEDIDTSIRLYPYNPESYLARGELYFQLKNYDLAIEDFDRVASSLPDNPAVYYHRGLVYTEMGEIDRAREDFETSLAKDPSFVAAYIGRGKLFEKVQQYEDAEANYTRAIQMEPNNHEAFYARGLLRAYFHRYTESLIDLDKAVKRIAGISKYHLARAQAYMGLEAYEDALGDINVAVKLDSANCKTYAQRGILHSRKRDYLIAGRDFVKALELDPQCQQALYGQALLDKSLDNLPKAIQTLDRLLTLNPKHIYAYCERGALYVKMEQYSKALADFEQAIRLDPNFGLAYDYRANMYESLMEYELAFQDYSKAIEINPSLADPYYNRAFMLSNSGRYNEAISDLEKAKAFSSGGTSLQFGLLAEIYARIENDSLFYINFQKALEMNFPTIEFELSPAFKTYRQESKFNEILERFKTKAQ